MCAAHEPGGSRKSRHYSVQISTSEALSTVPEGEAVVEKVRGGGALFNFSMESAWRSRSAVGPRQWDDLADSLSMGHPEKEQPPVKPGEHQDRRWLGWSHQTGLTRREQLKMMREFERLVLRKQDLRERNKAAGRHERKLDQELRKLSFDNVPSRGRLCIISHVFDNLCQGSRVLGGILKEIKTEYDLYLNSLLESQADYHGVPMECSQDGGGGSIMGAQDLEEARVEVSRLEKEAWEALEENERVRCELQSVLDQPCKDEDMTQQVDGQKLGEGSSSSADQLQLKSQQVCNAKEEVQTLERESRESGVSTDTAKQSMGDAKPEIIRLLASNEHLRNSNKDFEGNISVVFQRAKVTDNMKQQLWDKIWTALRHDGDAANETVNR
ncbi:uncharacterized protein C6orf118-like [Brienomyrus brachyistius]|uniref:uncharacterized protein C6orf118-like n=1 Tax=Brienomyrus brachyistius TaxID=42636 RepID=UPI0020B2F0FD|nr:uncharacterized protein C6orf118-like [Brienomyrus brachyistius]